MAAQLSARPLSHGLPSSSKLAPADIHVLLVDDERLSRTVVANLLRKCNYKVTTAEHGAEAMEILRSSPHGTFQLVLTDICMPQVNGIELLQLVKQDDSFRSVPVIMMSSIEQDETVLECVQGGADEYLVKPVTKKELQHIWQHVWRKQLASAATVPQAQPPAPALPPPPSPALAASVAPAAVPAAPVAVAAVAGSPEASSVGEHPAGPPAAAAAAPAAAGRPQQLSDVRLAPAAAAPAPQQQQQPLPQAVPLGDFVSSPAGLDKRVKLFGVAVALLQSCHAHAAPLLRLRPYGLGITPQGLRVIDDHARAQQAQQQQHEGRASLDALYASPEERRAAASGAAAPPGGHSAGVTMAADVFSLGALFVDLFLPRGSLQERCAQLAALQSGVLPAELAGAGAELAPLREFVKALTQPEPRLRPMLAHLVRSGQLAEAYRLVQQLPAWRARQGAATQQPHQQQAVPSGTAPSQEAAQPAGRQEAAASVQPPCPEQQESQLQPCAAPAADAVAEAGAEPDVDSLRHFLHLLREARLAEACALQCQLAAVDADTTLVLSRALGTAAAAAQQQLPRPLLEAAEAGAGPEQPPAKRQRTEAPAGGPLAALAALEAPGEQCVRLDAAMPQLEELFFAKRVSSGWTPAQLDAFAEDLDILARRGGLSVKATLRCGEMATPMEMACCVAFDRDDQLFATVGVSRRVKLFDFRACLESDPGMVHYPVLQMATRSKLSSVSWNAYVRSRLVTADYDGLIQLWDAGAGGAELQQFDEHARRVWSVDFSRADPTRFLSGSDDGTVRLWSMHDEASVLQIKAPANVCSVQFSPTDSHLVAFGCANYRVYVHDLRQPREALGTIAGPQRAVSYVRFMGGTHLVAASTDSTLRLWDLREVLGGRAGSGDGEGAAAQQAQQQPQLCFRGHRNQRNFVGLSVTADGYIACGSEDNQVHCYYRSLPFSVGRHQFAAGPEAGGAAPGHPPFVSAVCWANRSRHCLAANSQGIMEVLHME